MSDRAGSTTAIDLRDSLSVVTRKERRNLLMAASAPILMAWAGLVPTKIEGLGVTFTASQRSLTEESPSLDRAGNPSDKSARVTEAPPPLERHLLDIDDSFRASTCTLRVVARRWTYVRDLFELAIPSFGASLRSVQSMAIIKPDTEGPCVSTIDRIRNRTTTSIAPGASFR